MPPRKWEAERKGKGKGSGRREGEGEGDKGRREGMGRKKLTHIRILLNTSITTKKPHALATLVIVFSNQARLILIRLIHQLVRLDITIKIIAHEVIIPMIDDRITQSGEAARVAKHVGFDGVEDAGEVGVEGEVAVGVGVAEVFDVFGEVAEEEDVVGGYFAGYFDLRRGGDVLVRGWIG